MTSSCLGPRLPPRGVLRSPIGPAPERCFAPAAQGFLGLIFLRFTVAWYCSCYCADEFLFTLAAVATKQSGQRQYDSVSGSGRC